MTPRPGLLIPAVVGSLWLTGMIAGDRWSLFAENGFMSVTMAFGSFIAGATSEGGGAVAFPVMTLVFGIDPAVARDFALMIQAVGMNAAAATILALGIPVERRALLWASIGGAVGIVFGLDVLAPLLPPRYTKMVFLSVWLAFAFALYWINRDRQRPVRQRIEGLAQATRIQLVTIGVVGGVISGLTGSGLDILVFSLLVLRFGLSEAVATPTSVILMGVNAALGFAWKSGVGEGMAGEAWGYWWVCVPVVVIGAPAGARFIRNRSRHFIAGILYVSIVVQFVAGLLIIPQSPALTGTAAAVFGLALLGFRWMSRGALSLDEVDE